ncbi:MAG TPA: membrane dipeptidase, partial [Streptosporangiaceae bacterium]
MTDGYTAYSYLTAGQDFRTFELTPEFGRVPPYQAGLTEEQQQRAQKLLSESLVISLHDHPVRFPLRMEETPEYNRTGRQHAAYAGLAASGLTVVFDNMMDGTACVTGNAPWRWNDIITDLGMRQADLAHQDDVTVIRRVADIDEVYRSGGVGLVFGLESATPIENELDRLDVLYGLGLRQIGIAYSDANALGAGLAERTDAGLTAFGRRAVTRMNKLGLAIDLSHAGDRTALDTCEQSERPVFITHAGARAVWDIPRMKPDDVLCAVAATGGVIGMSAAPHTTLSAAHPRHSIESVMDHFRYCADLVGLDHVAFGPDTLYGDHVALHRIFAHLLSISAARGPAFDPVAYVDGLENPTENFANICGWLVQHGYDDTEIRAVLGGNIYRALQSIWVLPKSQGRLDQPRGGEQRHVRAAGCRQLDPDRQRAVPPAGQNQRRLSREVEHAGKHPFQLPLRGVHRRGRRRGHERGGGRDQHVDVAVHLRQPGQQVVATPASGGVGLVAHRRCRPEQPQRLRTVALRVALDLITVHLPRFPEQNLPERRVDLSPEGTSHVPHRERPAQPGERVGQRGGDSGPDVRVFQLRPEQAQPQRGRAADL